MAAATNTLTVDQITLEVAVLRIISEIRPRITRPHDVISVHIEPDGITVVLRERDHDGYPVINRTHGTVGTITRRSKVRVHLMETDE